MIYTITSSIPRWSMITCGLVLTESKYRIPQRGRKLKTVTKYFSVKETRGAPLRKDLDAIRHTGQGIYGFHHRDCWINHQCLWKAETMCTQYSHAVNGKAFCQQLMSNTKYTMYWRVLRWCLTCKNYPKESLEKVFLCGNVFLKKSSQLHQITSEWS